jgi:4-hydroxyphenylpyruvate dioxygenase
MAPKVEPLGIRRIEAIHYYVHDLDRSRHFYVDMMDFAEIGGSSADLVARGRQRSVVFQADDCVVVCSAPQGEGGRAWRYLQKHPDGIGTIALEVDDAERAFVLLEGRGGTPICDVQTFSGEGGTLKTFSITTPFGDTTFRFVERRGYRLLYPEMEAALPARGGKNAFGFSHFDHVTSNFETMAPALLWLEYVMGFERYWDVAFHTQDVAKNRAHHGSGLKSVVMHDAASGVKFANNEPRRPYFKDSQINVFHEEHRGDGVQHVALAVRDIIAAVRGLMARGLEFMPTPGTYYDVLPERLASLGVGTIDEQIGTLRELGILVDGSAQHRYLLQIFLKDSAGLYRSKDAGPFFYEIIHRKGDAGFGAGNFRALFESIEREQAAAERG